MSMTKTVETASISLVYFKRCVFSVRSGQKDFGFGFQSMWRNSFVKFRQETVNCAKQSLQCYEIGWINSFSLGVSRWTPGFEWIWIVSIDFWMVKIKHLSSFTRLGCLDRANGKQREGWEIRMRCDMMLLSKEEGRCLSWALFVELLSDSHFSAFLPPISPFKLRDWWSFWAHLLSPTCQGGNEQDKLIFLN
jgi:hypothetical protein